MWFPEHYLNFSLWYGNSCRWYSKRVCLCSRKTLTGRGTDRHPGNPCFRTVCRLTQRSVCRRRLVAGWPCLLAPPPPVHTALQPTMSQCISVTHRDCHKFTLHCSPPCPSVSASHEDGLLNLSSFSFHDGSQRG